MRLLHTADWHLGDRLGTVDRAQDQMRSIEAILAHCEENRVDVLVVAGDVFNDYATDNLSGLMREFARRLAPCFRRGMRVLLLSGNHDKEQMFQLLEMVQTYSGPEAARRLYFVGRPRILRLEDPSTDSFVQFALAPYPTVRRYIENDSQVKGLMAAERRQLLARAFASKIEEARGEVDAAIPSVLVSHVYVRGTETSTLYRMNEEDDIPVEPSDIPTWSYVALGHIHKAQEIGARSTVRYSGSPDRMDLGERNDQKSCVMVDIGRGSVADSMVLLPLPVTPMYSIRVNPGDDIDQMASLYPDHERALVHLDVTWRPGADNISAMVAELRRIFPRHFRLDQRPLTEASVARRLDSDPLDMTSTVRAYLARKLEPGSGRDRIFALADELVEEVRNAALAD